MNSGDMAALALLGLLWMLCTFPGQSFGSDPHILAFNYSLILPNLNTFFVT